jgi:glycosyltransferase involved in cell wall biosynthesis
MKKLKFIDLTLYSLEGETDVEEIINSQVHSLPYLRFIDNEIEKKVIKYCGINKKFEKDGIKYEFIKGKNKKWNMHLSLFYKLKKHKPTAIFIHSFMFAWQIIILRLFVGKKTKIIVQNHAELPFRYPKLIIQKIAAKCIDIYFLVSFEQAPIWIQRKVFDSQKKIREIMEGSTLFTYRNKSDSKKELHFEGDTLFLWCGSLNKNKDPLTILTAFEKYSQVNPTSYLYMVFNSSELINEVKEFIESNSLHQQVILLGRLPYKELEKYYCAADFFLLGSSREGSGFSLCEAMACGCIPIVSNIPSFKKMTDEGKCGFLFTPGDAEGLYRVLMKLPTIDKASFIKKVIDKFNKDLSFQAIASGIEKEIKS